jgi:hypothetical protein
MRVPLTRKIRLSLLRKAVRLGYSGVIFGKSVIVPRSHCLRLAVTFRKSLLSPSMYFNIFLIISQLGAIVKHFCVNFSGISFANVRRFRRLCRRRKIYENVEKSYAFLIKKT